MIELTLVLIYGGIALFTYGFWVRMSMEDWNTDTKTNKIILPIIAALLWPVIFVVTITR